MKFVLALVVACFVSSTTFAQPVTRSESYFSQAEGRQQSFQVVLPADYSDAVKHPLFVQVFGSNALMPSKEYAFIRIRPSGRGVWGYRSMSRYDVMQAVAATKQKYNIDEDRVYLTGTSAGATGMMHTAALRQDVFAGLVPLVAFGNDLPLANFRNLPIRCEHGANDWTSSIGNVRVQFQKLKKLGYDAELNEHPTAGHGIRLPPPATMKWLFAQKRNRSPRQVVHTCEHPRDGKAYWLTIEEFDDPHRIARVDTGGDGKGVSIKTDNVRSLSLDRATWPLMQRQKLLVDGTLVDFSTVESSSRLRLVKTSGWTIMSAASGVTGHRRAYGAGAAANLFQGEPLLVVYGTGGDDKENQFLRQTAGVLARCGGPHFRSAGVRFPIRADTDLDDVALEKYNLLLVGTTETNSYIKRIADKLPYAIKQGALHAGDREPLTLEGAVLSSLYFNPEQTGRLVYVVSPYLSEAERALFLKNPRKFLAGSDGFKMIDQPDLMVRGVDLKIRREMQFDSDWKFQAIEGADQRIPKSYSNRDDLAIAHMRVMRKLAKVDYAMWWGAEDKGSFGGYDFNWLPTFDPASYTRADYLVRRRETECFTATLTGTELLDFVGRWIEKDELISVPAVKKEAIDANSQYRIVIPMDLVVKLGTRRKTLSDVAPGPAIMPEDVAKEIWRSPTEAAGQ